MLRTSFILGGVAIVLFTVTAFLYNFGRPVKTDKAVLTLKGRSFDVEIAATMTARNQGLSGRSSLAENSAMLFVFDRVGSYGFWMKDMNFPLDLLWFRGNTLVGITKNVQPEPGKTIVGLKVYYPPETIDRVLEINAGLSDRYGFAAGDTYQLSQ